MIYIVLVEIPFLNDLDGHTSSFHYSRITAIGIVEFDGKECFFLCKAVSGVDFRDIIHSRLLTVRRRKTKCLSFQAK